DARSAEFWELRGDWQPGLGEDPDTVLAVAVLRNTSDHMVSNLDVRSTIVWGSGPPNTELVTAKRVQVASRRIARVPARLRSFVAFPIQISAEPGVVPRGLW